MSPAPLKNLIPQEQRWTIVQRGMEWDDIRTISQKIVELDGKTLDGHHKELIGHLVDSSHKNAWLKIWVTVIQTLGLAYTADKGTTIHVTDLGRYAANENDPLGFYLYWALRFQFPHATPKQKHYIINKVCLQPILLLIDYFLRLPTGAGNHLYLTYDEIINFCMKQKTQSSDSISEDVQMVLKNRGKGYNYNKERNLQGYDQVYQQLASRSKLYFEPVYVNSGTFLKYQPDRITISKSKLKAAATLLHFQKEPIPFQSNKEESRNRYIRTAFSCSSQEIGEIVNAYKTSRIPVEVLKEKKLDELEEQADEYIQKEVKVKSKKQLLVEARSYSASESHKYQITKAKVRLDDEKQKARIKAIEDYSCQIDGWQLEYQNKEGKKLKYIEAAHIKEKSLKGTEALDNIIILCPNCHKLLDKGVYMVVKEERAIYKNGEKIDLDHDAHLFID